MVLATLDSKAPKPDAYLRHLCMIWLVDHCPHSCVCVLSYLVLCLVLYAVGPYLHSWLLLKMQVVFSLVTLSRSECKSVLSYCDLS